ncbi:uncharacterized protein B0I36DRAFT_23716 [Microdochium trichocladiopsis]|uniref:Uncharacterized protein n=1 Tax=Microdochium trichocladiopsis TaxID=1682393 RepID=A0A9P8YKB1_9PEZI|nr:uncharacterized protein B0I36DRAFT_23716 [Microdochium trichocladiopsis]KAH7041463.1 hypothetical protein B0I36DRAFT_23716 [Microdochium trichocladiopsis]
MIYLRTRVPHTSSLILWVAVSLSVSNRETQLIDRSALTEVDAPPSCLLSTEITLILQNHKLPFDKLKDAYTDINELTGACTISVAYGDNHDPNPVTVSPKAAVCIGRTTHGRPSP